MPFPERVKVKAFIACGRCCCLCHEYCAVHIEAHHIVPEAQGGADDDENCIPLCYRCHAEVEHYNVKHPRGNKFTPAELRGHRDGWYKKSALSGVPSAGAQAADPSSTIITKDDVLGAFRAIPDFTDDAVADNIDYLHKTLLKNGVVFQNQLRELVAAAPILNSLRKIYVDVLLRDPHNPLDPAAVAVWAAQIYSYGLREDVLQAIRSQLLQSREYRDKHGIQ